MKVPGMDSVRLLPANGFVDSVPADSVPLNMATGPSKDWLIVGGRLVRRNGSHTDTDGILESSWDAKARKVIAARLKSSTSNAPCPVVLHTNETTKKATLAFKANGAWRTVGQDFSYVTYPSTGVPTHRVVPMVYRNEYGGLTVHRLNTAEYREHMAAGSRGLALVEENVCLPCYDGVPMRWDGGFGTDPCNVSHLTMVRPLQFPTIALGEDLGTTEGAWVGSYAFFFSCLYEDEQGHLSSYPRPVPPSVSAAASEGVGYFKIGVASHNYKTLEVTGIPQGPQGTRYIWGLRSPQVDTDATGGGAIQPQMTDLMLWFRVPQGRTSYTADNGNDLDLVPDVRLARMLEQQAAPPARYIGAFDGRSTEGCLRAHPGALWVAPWESGAVNGSIDDASLYGTRSYFVAVTPTQMILRTVDSGVATDLALDIEDKTLREMQYTPSKGLMDGSPVNITSWNVPANGNRMISRNCTTNEETTAMAASLSAGMRAESTGVPTGTAIESVHYVIDVKRVYVKLTQAPTIPAGGNAVFIFTPRVTGTTYPKLWAMGVYDGADPEESAENLLRTYVREVCTFTVAELSLRLASNTNAKYITPGMLVYSDKFNSNTVVTAVNRTSGVVTLSKAAIASSTTASTGGDEYVEFGYDTGDYALAGDPGFVRTFANSFPAPLFWNLDYLNRFRPALYATTFSAGSPGYAQDAVDVWMAGNRRGGRTAFGAFMGLAEVGAAELSFSARGRMCTANFRTGTTHQDEDYTRRVVSWDRGACSPYAICELGTCVIFASDIGICACDDGPGEHLISQVLYNPGRKPGERGQLEYAIEASQLAADNDGDDFKIHAQVIGSVLYVQYHTTSGLSAPDREIRYDFSAGVGRTGLAQVLRPDGSPYPWSTPLTIGPSASCLVSDSLSTYRIGAFDGNTGATDGRLDVLDVGTTDNGTLVTPDWYTGVKVQDSPMQDQHFRLRVKSTKDESGLSIALCQNPDMAEDESEWDEVQIDGSGVARFKRSCKALDANSSMLREAVQYRIRDDGAGSCPEVAQVSLDTEQKVNAGLTP